MPDPLVTVFYDGHCGLCHGLVRFLLARDPSGNKFDFAPLQGEFCAAAIPVSQRSGLGDSVVVRSSDGQLLVKSAAVLYLLHRIGGSWRAVGMIAGILPRRLRDHCYDFIARHRRRLFSAPPAACPLLPPGLRQRFHP